MSASASNVILDYFNEQISAIPFSLDQVIEAVKCIVISILKLSLVIAFGLLIAVVGYFNLDVCPLKPDIPLYLFVQGK